MYIFNARFMLCVYPRFQENFLGFEAVAVSFFYPGIRKVNEHKIITFWQLPGRFAVLCLEGTLYLTAPDVAELYANLFKCIRRKRKIKEKIINSQVQIWHNPGSFLFASFWFRVHSGFNTFRLMWTYLHFIFILIFHLHFYSFFIFSLSDT